MPRRVLPIFALAAAMLATAQAQVPNANSDTPEPKIRVNILNVCHPPEGDVEEMRHALAGLKEQQKFAADFEIARGVTTLTEAEARATGESANRGPSSWVRIRHEFPEKSPLTDAQYSLSYAGGEADEMLVVHPRESKEVLQITISDSVTGSPLQAVQTRTPPDRIRIERFGKPSIVLARCAGADQSAYAPIFLEADAIMDRYRTAMAVKTVVPAELAHLPATERAGRKDSKAGGSH